MVSLTKASIISQAFSRLVSRPLAVRAVRELCPPYQSTSSMAFYGCHLWVDLFWSVSCLRDRPWSICSKCKVSRDHGREGKIWSMKNCLIFSEPFFLKTLWLRLFQTIIRKKSWQDTMWLKYPIIIFTVETKWSLLIATCHMLIDNLDAWDNTVETSKLIFI